MNRWAQASVAAIALALAAPAGAIDRVRLVGGGSEPGDIVRSTKNGVTLEQAAGSREIKTVEIDSILFDSEPAQLTQARINAANRGYATALEKLSEVRLARGERDLLKQEVAFYKAYCQAKAALAGDGDPAKAVAGLMTFAKSSGDSFHFYTAVETVGDLAVAMKRYGQADKLYATLAKSPFESLKVRALVRSGVARQAGGDHAAAIKRFDQAMKLGTRGAGAASEVLAAQLGKAESLAATDRINEAVASIAGVLSGLDEEDSQSNAIAYNTLGRCYAAAGRSQDALFAYLHTDLLFDREAETHAEALARLAELWREVGKPDAGREAAERLRREYPGTRWTRGAG